MRWTGALTLMLALVVPAGVWAQNDNAPRVETTHVDRVVIYEYGIYQTVSAGKYKDPSAPGGERGTVANIDLVERTANIPAELETEFGIRYVLDGGPDGANVPVTIVMRFPAPGLKEPG